MVVDDLVLTQQSLYATAAVYHQSVAAFYDALYAGPCAAVRQHASCCCVAAKEYEKILQVLIERLAEAATDPTMATQWEHALRMQEMLRLELKDVFYLLGQHAR